jgi:hypothetical protein
MLRICQPRSANTRRSRLSVFVILSVAALGCADVSDDDGATDALSDDGARAVDRADQTLLESKVVVTAVKGSSTTATVRAVDDAPKPKAPTVTVSDGPTIVSVTRDADPRATAKKDDAKKGSGGVTIKESGGKTIISVPGFPDITITPDKNSKDGGVIVSVPGRADFAAPADSVIEAPGGIKIAT